jgi:hypothetical protein
MSNSIGPHPDELSEGLFRTGNIFEDETTGLTIRPPALFILQYVQKKALPLVLFLAEDRQSESVFEA